MRVECEGLVTGVYGDSDRAVLSNGHHKSTLIAGGDGGEARQLHPTPTSVDHTLAVLCVCVCVCACACMCACV